MGTRRGQVLKRLKKVKGIRVAHAGSTDQVEDWYVSFSLCFEKKFDGDEGFASGVGKATAS
jgi:hypothetical protein